jgi:hypothetical protein
VEGTATPLLSSATLLLMKFSSENHSGDVNNHSGRIGFFIHFSPESLFTSRRNHYSHHSGTIIHMPRNPQLAILLHRLWVTGEVYEPLRNNQGGPPVKETGKAAA